MPMQDDLLNIIQLTNQQFITEQVGGNEMSNERYIQLISAANQNFKEMAAKFRDEKEQKNFGLESCYNHTNLMQI